MIKERIPISYISNRIKKYIDWELCQRWWKGEQRILESGRILSQAVSRSDHHLLILTCHQKPGIHFLIFTAFKQDGIYCLISSIGIWEPFLISGESSPQEAGYHRLVSCLTCRNQQIVSACSAQQKPGIISSVPVQQEPGNHLLILLIFNFHWAGRSAWGINFLLFSANRKHGTLFLTPDKLNYRTISSFAIEDFKVTISSVLLKINYQSWTWIENCSLLNWYDKLLHMFTRFQPRPEHHQQTLYCRATNYKLQGWISTEHLFYIWDLQY